MKLNDKKRFIRNLTGSITAELISKVRNMPEEWDGHELRALLADTFAFEVSSTMRDKRGRRYREYQNEVIVRNL
jgi:hypothetical protein